MYTLIYSFQNLPTQWFWGMPTCPLGDTFLVQVLMYIAVLRTADAIKVGGRLECAFGYLFISFHLHLRFSATLVQLPLI